VATPIEGSDEQHQRRTEDRGGIIRSTFTFRGSEQRVRPIEPLTVFTDAILAIAATVLIFELRIPRELAPHSLWRVLTDQWTTLLALLMSYLWLTSAWLNFRRLRRMLRGVDHYATVMYLLLVMTVTLIPPVMLMFTRSIGTPDFHLGVQLLAGLGLLNGIIICFLLAYAARRGLGVPTMTPLAWREVLVPNYVLTTLDLVVIVVAAWLPWLVLAFICVDWMYSLLPLFTDRVGAEEDTPDDIDEPWRRAEA
jgi:uncharacterized membrane protein